MDPIKEAFLKIKEEIQTVYSDINFLKKEISALNSKLDNLQAPTNASFNSTHTSTFTNEPTNNPTLPQEIRGFHGQFNDISTGNKGVPTVNQTNHQTINYTDKMSSFNDLQATLDSLDTIKKELRLKFKRLTNQEMAVFSTLYSLENQGLTEISYKIIAQTLNLSESSIREYVSKLIDKDIPILKIKENNKKVLLSISPELKKFVPLPTIIKLREL